MADGGAAAALDGAGGDGSAHGLLQKWAVWPSKQALYAEVAGVSETLGRSVRVAKSNRKYIMIKCTSAECSFRVSAKAVKDSAGWVIVGVCSQHTCSIATRRARNYRAAAVMRAAPAVARVVVPTMALPGGARQLCAMVAASGARLTLREGQARDFLKRRFGATDEHFVMELQLLADSLRQMGEQDPDGKLARGMGTEMLRCFAPRVWS